MPTQTVQFDITDLRSHFDAMYVGAIPRLLNDDGAFLSFLATLTATDALAGFCAPNLGTGERFRAFVARFFPKEFASLADSLWQFRNLMVHSFNPGPFILTFHQSRLHLTIQDGRTVLNAEDFYSALVTASRQYFDALLNDEALQRQFALRLVDDEGGGIQTHIVSRDTGGTV